MNYQKSDIIDMNWNIIPVKKRNEIIDQIKDLPITNKLDNITNTIINNLITIIEAQTGSWKTTQVWKLAMFSWLYLKKKLARVNMTQPRVIAALSNASRISDELLSQFNNPAFTLGELVWYRTGNYDKSSQNTKLLLTTDAQEVLRQLISKQLPDFLILDEVHTYTIDIEILLSLIYQYIKENPDIKTKFIIMTATLDKQLITSYFKSLIKKVPYITTPWKLFPIEEEILPSKKFINSIVNNVNLNGTGKVLAFVDWKRSIFKTIQNLNRVFSKNIIQSRINQMKSQIDKVFENIILDIKENIKNNNELTSLPNLDEINLFKNILKIELEKKIKNLSYTLNTEKIYSKIYLLLSKDNLQKNTNTNLDFLDTIYEYTLTNIENILNNVLYIDYKLSEFYSFLKKLEQEYNQIWNTVSKEIENINLNDKTKLLSEKINNINTTQLSWFLYLIINFLQKTCKKWVNYELVSKNIELAENHFSQQAILNKFNNIVQQYHLDKQTKETILNIFTKINFSQDLYNGFITQFNNIVEEIANYNNHQVKIVPLHSDLPQYEQEKVFDKDTKIIVSTNVAEMSVTIPDVDVIIDSWKEKISYIDDNWVPVLAVNNISKAQSKQRKWRTWRTRPGKYIWVNDTKSENLDDFPITEIEKWSFYRHYLILLAWWKKFEEINFLHKPNKKHIEIVKEHLKKLGAIDEKWEITDIGLKLVLIPTEPYVARMLYEGEKRKCLKNIIISWSIFETRSFLSSENKNWEKFNFKNTYLWNSDLSLFYNWYILLTKDKITESEKIELIKLWIDPSKLNNFNDNKKQLYEIIDIKKIWIKEKYFLELIENISRLERFYLDSWIQLTEKNINNNDVLLSVLSWMPDNIFEFDWKKFIHHKKWFFEKSWIGSIKPENKKHLAYIWKPFIIKEGNEKEKKIIQKIIKIDKSLLAELFDIHTNNSLTITTKIKKTRKKWKIIRTREKVLKQIKPIEWISLDNVVFEKEHNSFKYMFTHVYLPELLVNKNMYFKDFINKIQNEAEEWKIIDIKRLKTLIWKYTEQLYEIFITSELSPKKIEEIFKKDNTIFEKMMNDPNISFDLMNLYI